MRSDKRGQFYLLAAVVIITIIVGFASINNLVEKRGGVSLDDSADELNFESGEVLEYGVSSGEDPNDLIEHFTTSYAGYSGEEKNILFVIGDSSILPLPGGSCCAKDKPLGTNGCTQEGCSIEAFAYTDITTGSVGVGDSRLDISERDMDTFAVTITDVDEVTIIFPNSADGQEYVFDVRTGENFYFVISQEVNGEEFIVTN
jgi:hypothetical protein